MQSFRFFLNISMNTPHHGSPLYFGYGKEWQQPYVWGPWLSKSAKRKAVKYIGTAASTTQPYQR